MAKKDSIKPIYLFLGGVTIFGLAWLMPSFPLLAFIGLSPFIAIAVNNRKEKSMWTSLELVLLGLSISFFAGSIFSATQLTYSVIQAILFTIPFAGYTLVRKTFGPNVSVITLPLFWLGLEYFLLKWYPLPIIFLADILTLKPEWTSWNTSTGYLGSSLWILLCNVFIYQGVLTEKKVNWFFIVLFVLAVVGPIVYAMTLETNAITRNEMIELYSPGKDTLATEYSLAGEFVPRTAAWISVLILLFTLVKRKVTRK